MNRFTGDIATSDMGISAFLTIIFSLFCDIICSVFAISIATSGAFLIILFPLAFLFYRIQLYFRTSNTEIRRLESIAKSPVFTEISQSLSGISSLRAFASIPLFVDRLELKMNQYAAITFVKLKLNSWIFIRFDFLGAFVSFFVAVLSVAAGDFVPPEAMAVALTYSLAIPVFLTVLMFMGAEAEAMMSSVERIKYYIDKVPQEEGSQISHLDEHYTAKTDTSLIIPPADWPAEGKIEAVNVKMRYRDGPLVLNGIDFKINGRETIGIAGRTGSGKSSLLVALFRFEKLDQGTLYIDNIDISKIPLATLRSKLSIIPQDPVMFCESLRFNLDPFDEYTDEKLWEALDIVGLKDMVKSLPSQLKAEITEGGDNLSLGQRQVG